jgi:rhodanese-related sulfurtransferase
LVEPVAATAPEVDETRLRDLNAFLSGLPEGYFSVKPADLNVELGGAAAPVLVDVRTADEIAQGYIDGSLQIPIDTLLTSLDQLPDKSAPIVMLCQSGHRGSIGLMALRMLGYTEVRNLGGGINGWTATELPLAS